MAGPDLSGRGPILTRHPPKEDRADVQARITGRLAL